MILYSITHKIGRDGSLNTDGGRASVSPNGYIETEDGAHIKSVSLGSFNQKKGSLVWSNSKYEMPGLKINKNQKVRLVYDHCRMSARNGDGHSSDSGGECEVKNTVTLTYYKEKD